MHGNGRDRTCTVLHPGSALAAAGKAATIEYGSAGPHVLTGA